MCKLYAIIDIENELKAEKLLRAAYPYVTKSDHDGMGIMRLGEGVIHSQKWVTIPANIDAKPCVNSPYADALKLEYAEKGTRPHHVDAIALHGRHATCAVNIENTHPFQTAKTALMHNGIIHNVEAKDNKLSTCDSEALLWRYLNNGIPKYPERLSKALADVEGYYACIVFNTSGVVDIWTDDMAGLFLAKIKGVGTVISTTRDIILQSAKRGKFKTEWVYPVKAFTHLRWKKGDAPALRSFIKPAWATARASALEKEIKEYDTKAKATIRTVDDNWNPPKHLDAAQDDKTWWEEENDAQMKRIAEMKATPTLPAGI